MAHLVLRNKNVSSHVEEWTIKDGIIHVESVCPQNYPAISKHTLTWDEALRQYALMTSSKEGWEVEDDLGWYEFVESGKIK